MPPGAQASQPGACLKNGADQLGWGALWPNGRLNSNEHAEEVPCQGLLTLMDERNPDLFSLYTFSGVAGRGSHSPVRRMALEPK